MASENTALWDRLGRTDPAHTKQFTRAGGFKGTAIKPMFSYRRMTEEFGACGVGWGVGEPSFQVVPAGDETLVFCTVSVWHEKPDQRVFGVGGDKVVGKNKFGVQTDDEAFKKAFTDAVTNALKLIGVGADVHMGMFDDNKYVNTMKQEFAEPEAPQVPAKSSASLKRTNSWKDLQDELAQDMIDVRSTVAFEQVRNDYRKRAKEAGWPAAWLGSLANEFAYYEEQLKPSMLEAGE